MTWPPSRKRGTATRMHSGSWSSDTAADLSPGLSHDRPAGGCGRRRPGHVRAGVSAAGRFEARSNFATWLYWDGFNCAIGLHAGAAETRIRRDARHAGSDDTGARHPTMDDLVYAGEIGERADGARGLSAQERAAFLMRHYHGCSIEEICQSLVSRRMPRSTRFSGSEKMRVAPATMGDKACTCEDD